MINEIYLDNSATTKPYNDVIDVMNTICKRKYGNASSQHIKGWEVKQEIIKAREIIAASLKVECNSICFTSGGTESNNIAIIGTAYANQDKGRHIITSTIEHPSVLNAIKSLEEKGFEVEYIGVNNKGFVEVNKLFKMVRHDTILVSIMHVNNEVGSVQPVERISQIIKSKNQDVLFHVDAVQAYGKIPVYPHLMGADLLTLSAHKIHGPKGIGALYFKDGTKLSPIIFGGGQEGNIRSGTENVPGICGFGKAVEITFKDIKEKSERINTLKNMLKLNILEYFPEAIINSPDEGMAGKYSFASPHILSVSFSKIRANDLV